MQPADLGELQPAGHPATDSGAPDPFSKSAPQIALGFLCCSLVSRVHNYSCKPMSSQAHFVRPPNAASDGAIYPDVGEGQHPIVLAHCFSRFLELRSVEEDWTGITEQAKRRRLQNRLNQRARRECLHPSPVALVQ